MAAVKCKHLTRWILLVTQTLFSFRDVPIGQLTNNAYFNRQAAIFADFLHTMVSFVQLDSENLLRDLCHRVGVKHAQFTSIDFEPDWWRLFVNAAIDCLQPYFPPGYHSASESGARRLSSNMVAQLPFVGQWLRDSYKQAWTTLLEHAVQLMSEAFTNYKTRGFQGSSASSNFDQGSRGDDRNSTGDGRRFGIFSHGRDDAGNSHDPDDDEDQVELQLVIVTTPVEDYIAGEDDHIDLGYDGYQSEEQVESEGGDESYSCSSMRNTTTAPTVSCMTTSFSMQQPLPPRSWETTRKRVLRLNSLEDWDLQD